MDDGTVALLLENLLDRLELDASSGKWRLGTLTSREKTALELVVQMLGRADGAPETSAAIPTASPAPATTLDPAETWAPATSPADDVPEQMAGSDTAPASSPADGPAPRNEGAVQASWPLPPLGLISLDAPVPSENITLCLDFGTAMSKAFAIRDYDHPVELGLGRQAGGSGYTVDSSLFISDEGRIHFGPRAVELSRLAAETGRARFDSPKARLTVGEPGEIDRIQVPSDINPTTVPLSEGDLITLYLGYLTDLAVSELQSQGHSRLTRRRFARPCWPADRTRWAVPLMKRMLAQGQVLADTFHHTWQAGIPVEVARGILDAVRALPRLPEHLILESVPEPVAVAASLMVKEDEGQRDVFLVIDVGAGTTDFGVFLLQNNPHKDICRILSVQETSLCIREAGDRVDDLLKFHVLHEEGIDPGSPEGRHNNTYLSGRIRIYKEALFRDGIVEITLANESRAVIDRERFLQDQRVKNFAKRLSDKMEEVLGFLGDGFLDLLSRNPLYVVLTGGGAALPMVQALARGVSVVRGRHIQRVPAAGVPEWISETYPQFEPQYPQLAVAIGGAAHELPESGLEIGDFMGLGRRA